MGKFPNYENNDDVKVNVWGTSHVTEIAFSHIVYHQGNNCSNIPFNEKQSVTDGATSNRLCDVLKIRIHIRDAIDYIHEKGICLCLP